MSTTTPATTKAPRAVRVAVLLLAILATWSILGLVVASTVFGAHGLVRAFCAVIVTLGQLTGTV